MIREQGPQGITYRRPLWHKAILLTIGAYLLWQGWRMWQFIGEAPPELQEHRPTIYIVTAVLLCYSILSILAHAFAYIEWGRASVKVFPRSRGIPWPIEFPRNDVKEILVRRSRKRRGVLCFMLNGGRAVEINAGGREAETEVIAADLRGASL